MGRQVAGRQGRDLFSSGKGGQEENWSSGDEDSSIEDEKGEGGDVGPLEILLDLIGMHPGLDMTAPLMQSVEMEGHYAVGSDTSGTVIGKMHRREPTQYGLNSRRI